MNAPPPVSSPAAEMQLGGSSTFANYSLWLYQQGFGNPNPKARTPELSHDYTVVLIVRVGGCQNPLQSPMQTPFPPFHSPFFHVILHIPIYLPYVFCSFHFIFHLLSTWFSRIGEILALFGGNPEPLIPGRLAAQASDIEFCLGFRGLG